MGKQNRYCTRCQKTQAFRVDGQLYTCQACGVRVELTTRRDDGRILWGDPFQFRIRFV
jgi:ribosomal protein L37AE/L43A